jgi:hypothetical protein
MSDPPSTDQPKLAPPGAGLPWLELRIARLGFKFLSRRTTREKSAALLAQQRADILELARRCDAQTGARRVLVRRLRGMEDSSRFWSVFMTLDHLRIVNLAVAGTIRMLGQGKTSDRKVSTADVKPDPRADGKVVDEFDLSCRLVERCAGQVPDLKTRLRFDHPWFGSLDAAQWYFLAGIHLRLHRQQIELIIRRVF